MSRRTAPPVSIDLPQSPTGHGEGSGEGCSAACFASTPTPTIATVPPGQPPPREATRRHGVCRKPRSAHSRLAPTIRTAIGGANVYAAHQLTCSPFRSRPLSSQKNSSSCGASGTSGSTNLVRSTLSISSNSSFVIIRLVRVSRPYFDPSELAIGLDRVDQQVQEREGSFSLTQRSFATCMSGLVVSDGYFSSE
jgi:hypothetical protein